MLPPADDMIFSTDINTVVNLVTDIFRLIHILQCSICSSILGGIVDYNDWNRRGQYQLSDDPCVLFRHKEFDIMTKLITGNVYDFRPDEKLKLLVLLCNQALTLSTTREYMEDAFDKYHC